MKKQIMINRIIKFSIHLIFTLSLFLLIIEGLPNFMTFIIENSFDYLSFDSVVVKICFLFLLLLIIFFYKYNSDKPANEYLVIPIASLLTYLLYRFIIPHPNWSFVIYCYVFTYLDLFFFFLFVPSGIIYLIKNIIEKKSIKSDKTKNTDKTYKKIVIHHSINTPAEDKFNYYLDAKRLMKEVLSENNKYLYEEEALTISLKGEWGLGKTSYLNLIEHSIKTDVNSGVYNNAIIIKFSPWYSSSLEQIMVDFFNTLKNAIKDYSIDFELPKEINKYSKLLSKSNYDVIPDFINVLSGFDKELSIEKQFNLLNSKIVKLKKPLLIFVDDLDRLESKEILYVIQLIRNSANFKNTIFIVPYDETYVHKTLESAIIEPKRYLQKIFKVPYSLPPINDENYKNYLAGIFFSGLIINEKDNPIEANSVRFFIENINTRLDIRTANSIIENISLNKSIFVDEHGFYNIYLYDWLLIEYLRLLCPDLYNKLDSDRIVVNFTEIYEFSSLEYLDSTIKDENEKKQKKNKLFFEKRILPFADNNIEYATKLYHILKLIFENDNKTSLNKNLTHYVDKNPYRLRNSIIFRNYFDKYLNSSTILRSEILEALNSSNEKELLELEKRNTFLFSLLLNSVTIDEKESGLSYLKKTLFLYKYPKKKHSFYRTGIINYPKFIGVNILDNVDFKNQNYTLYIESIKEFLFNSEKTSKETLCRKFSMILELRRMLLPSSIDQLYWRGPDYDNRIIDEYHFEKHYILYLKQYLSLQRSEGFENFNTDFIETLDSIKNVYNGRYFKNEAIDIIKTFIAEHVKSLISKIKTFDDLINEFCLNKVFDSLDGNWLDNYLLFLDNLPESIKKKVYYNEHLKLIIKREE